MHATFSPAGNSQHPWVSADSSVMLGHAPVGLTLSMLQDPEPGKNARLIIVLHIAGSYSPLHSLTIWHCLLEHHSLILRLIACLVEEPAHGPVAWLAACTYIIQPINIKEEGRSSADPWLHMDALVPYVSGSHIIWCRLP
jgi:hypothetical protein